MHYYSLLECADYDQRRLPAMLWPIANRAVKKGRTTAASNVVAHWQQGCEKGQDHKQVTISFSDKIQKMTFSSIVTNKMQIFLL